MKGTGSRVRGPLLGSPRTVCRSLAVICHLQYEKRVHYRSAGGYVLDMIRMARPHECVRIYTVYSDGHATGTAFVVRDRDTAVRLVQQPS